MQALQQNKSLCVPRDGRSDQPREPWVGEIYASHALQLAGEVWQPIPGFEKNGYEISDLGRIRRNQGHSIRLLRPSIRNKALGVSGRYLRSEIINNDGLSKTVFIHGLVARVFHGEPQSPELQAAHLNGDSVDNRAANLAWATPQENSDHQVIHGTRLMGDKHPNVKLCRHAILLIHHLVHQEGWTIARIAAVSGTSTLSVSRIAKGNLRKQTAQQYTEYKEDPGQ